jgi:hypothetical protein
MVAEDQNRAAILKGRHIGPDMRLIVYLPVGPPKPWNKGDRTLVEAGAMVLARDADPAWEYGGFRRTGKRPCKPTGISKEE